LNLVITEKPSVAMDISRALSEPFVRHDGYLEGKTMIITWAVGHLLELAMPQDYDPALEKWSLDRLPFIPDVFKLKPKASTKTQLKIIADLVKRKDVDRLINACDAGREGELIFRYIIQYLNCRKPHDRLWLSETTPAAIQRAFSNLRSSAEVDNLARAAVARSQADWIIGINATRGYTVKHGEKLTVGRVQTPTLALLVNREREIERFVPQPYFEIEATFEAESAIYQGKWFRGEQDRFSSHAEAEILTSKLNPGSPGRVEKVDKREKAELAPMLFNLTDLQREANKRFGFTADHTLNIAQKLYESHLLTYPRTDSRHLTTDMAATLPARLNALRRTELGHIVTSIHGSVSDKRFVDDKKVTDHTAIIVTEVSPNLSSLTEDEAKIYLLVAKRMVGIFLPPARFMQTTVITRCQDETFLTKGKVILDPGWKILYADTEDESPALPDLDEGQEVVLKVAEILDKQTQPPKRFTEADLLSAMENVGLKVEDEELREAMKGKGLGTPATRAAIIEKLIQVGYVIRQKKTLVPTEKGKLLIDLVEPRLKDPELTAEWEKKLMDIEQGRYHSSQFMAEIKELARDTLSEIASQEAATVAFAEKDSLGNCPLCGKPVFENKKAYSCSGWKEGCRFVIWKVTAGKKITPTQAKKLLNNGRSNLIKGFKSKAGKSFDAFLVVSEGKIVFEFPKS